MKIYLSGLQIMFKVKESIFTDTSLLDNQNVPIKMAQILGNSILMQVLNVSTYPSVNTICSNITLNLIWFKNCAGLKLCKVKQKISNIPLCVNYRHKYIISVISRVYIVTAAPPTATEYTCNQHLPLWLNFTIWKAAGSWSPLTF